MAATSPELNKFVSDYILWCLIRQADYVEKHSVEDDVSGYTCYHTTPKPAGMAPDRSIHALTDKLRVAPLAAGYDFETEGWQVGNVAWCITFLRARLPCGDDIPEEVRGTTVLRHVDGDWKVAHLHLSEGYSRPANMIPPSK